MEIVIRITQQHILLPYDIEQAALSAQIGMIHRGCRSIKQLLRPNPREIDKVLEVVITAAGNQVLLLEEFDLSEDEGQQIRRDPFVERHSHRRAFLALLDTLLDLLHPTLRHIAVDVELRVTRHLDRIGFAHRIIEIRKEVVQAIPDHIFE